jgi:hypothetical protein
MYALARNAGKYASRDKRTDKSITLEYDYLAPDTVNEMFDALRLMKRCVGETFSKDQKKINEDTVIRLGERLLEQNKITDDAEIYAGGMENSDRKVQLVKLPKAYHFFKDFITYYGTSQLIQFIQRQNISSFEQLMKTLPKPKRDKWMNIGGQMMTAPSVSALIRNINSGKIKSWDQVHDYYKHSSDLYSQQKLQHAFASLLEAQKLSPQQFTKKVFFQLLNHAVATREWMTHTIYESRAKDYQNEFRRMVYDTEKEMEKVIGKLKDNAFINQQQEELKQFKKQVAAIEKVFRI